MILRLPILPKALTLLTAPPLHQQAHLSSKHLDPQPPPLTPAAPSSTTTHSVRSLKCVITTSNMCTGQVTHFPPARLLLLLRAVWFLHQNVRSPLLLRAVWFHHHSMRSLLLPQRYRLHHAVANKTPICPLIALLLVKLLLMRASCPARHCMCHSLLGRRKELTCKSDRQQPWNLCCCMVAGAAISAACPLGVTSCTGLVSDRLAVHSSRAV